jgi:hypothetical protein
MGLGLGLVGWFWMGDGVEEAWCGTGFLTRCCFAGVYVYSTPRNYITKHSISGKCSSSTKNLDEGGNLRMEGGLDLHAYLITPPPSRKSRGEQHKLKDSRMTSNATKPTPDPFERSYSLTSPPKDYS